MIMPEKKYQSSDPNVGALVTRGPDRNYVAEFLSALEDARSFYGDREIGYKSIFSIYEFLPDDFEPEFAAILMQYLAERGKIKVKWDEGHPFPRILRTSWGIEFPQLPD